MGTKATTLALVVLAAAHFCADWTRSLRTRPPGNAGARPWPSAIEVVIGVVTDFFDTLGIGSFATTTSLFRLLRKRVGVPDRLIPGTLNVGHTIPTVAQALIYIAIVRVEAATLVLMIAGALSGAWFGAGVVARWPVRPIRAALGTSLMCAAALMVAQQLHALPGGGQALGLRGAHLALGVAGNVTLGALMTLGIGLYGPCMMLVSALGMNPTAAFPIMMGSCAFLMPVAGSRFIARRAYVPSAALGLALGGTPAVLVAAGVVGSLPLTSVRWLVIVVIGFAAAQMLSSAVRAEPDRDASAAASIELR